MSNNLNDKGKQVFKEYRWAYDSMEANPVIRRARRAIEQYQASLGSLEAPYREKMAEAEGKIVEAVLAQEESVTLFGVHAKYTRGGESTSTSSSTTTSSEPSVHVKVI